MHHRTFLALVDDKRVVSAIQDAEKKTSGQLRVFVSHHQVPEPMEAARLQFHRLGMAKTWNRNAILIFIAPKSHTFSIYGDIAIDQKCGPEFWEKVRDEIIPHLKAAEYTTALIHAITRTGEKLAEYFPPDGKSRNDLPDNIARD